MLYSSEWRLYVILSASPECKSDPLELASLAIGGGADIIQLRYKGKSLREAYGLAKSLRRLTREAKIPLIINDRVDLALAVEADGVHLGQDDLPYEQARRILGSGKVIGLSCHSLKQARQAETLGPDYISLGPVFPTRSKPDAKPALGLEVLTQAQRELQIPLVAIGGIALSNLSKVIEAGARRIAVISAISQAADPAAAARKLKDTLQRRL